jgi:Flp pilus assembly protein TadG
MKARTKMRPRLNRAKGTNSERGQALALMAVTMAGLLGIAALGVDLGYLYVARNELQNVADGSALAGARILGHTYQGLTPAQQQGYVCDAACENIIDSTANYVAHQNSAAGLEMDLLFTEVIIGQWDGDNFTVTNAMPDAVKVISRRDEVHNGPVTTFFARVLGVNASSVNAWAIAALTGQGTAAPGDIELPIGISQWFFQDPDYCHDDIQFYPTNDPASCAGWTSWEYGSNDVTLRHILDEDDGYDSPRTVADSSIFAFTGGTLSNPTFDAMLSLFQRKGYDTKADGITPSEWYADNGVEPKDIVPITDPPYWDLDALVELDADGLPVMEDGHTVPLEYPDGTPRFRHAWETTVPVYDRDDCSNPNQEILILGFAEVIVKDVYDAPDKLVRGIVNCDLVDEFASRGGGGEYGVMGSVPGLVR